MSLPISAKIDEGMESSVLAHRDGVAALADQLARLHPILRRAVLRFRADRCANIEPGLNGMAVFDAEVDDILSAPPSLHRGISNTATPTDLPDPLANTLLARPVVASPTIGPFETIRNCFQLSAPELDAMLLCVASELFQSYGRLYAYLHNDLTRNRPSVGLILDVLSDNWVDRTELRRLLSRDAPLFRHGLLVASNGDGLSLEIAIEPTILDYLLGGPLGPCVVASRNRARDLDELTISEAGKERLVGIADLLHQTGKLPSGLTIILLPGVPGAGRQTAAAAICRRAGYRLFAFEPAVTGVGAIARLRSWLRDVRIGGGVPAIYLAVNDVDQVATVAEMTQALHDIGFWFAFILADVRSQSVPSWPDGVHVLSIELDVPSARLRRKAWRNALRELQVECAEQDLKAVAAIYPFTVGKIRHAAADAVVRHRLDRSDESQVDFVSLVGACRVNASHRLGQFAQRLVTPYDWADLVLPPDELQRLREIADAVRNREQVLERWGFAKLSTGPGVTALFFGASGTGKTMAASIVANDIGMDIYRVDLSRVVSKYIGETEKNLDAVFEEARRAFAVLFFDEADALFGKRSEVKDAHDRYANIEVAFLLQRMEEYEGVAILATNLRKNMDSAFLRRLQHAVEFPLPPYAQRLQIWRQIWPEAAAIAPDVDLDFMARRFDLAGGHIRNIALVAALLAAQQRTPVSMAHIVAATRREFQKLGRLCVAHEFGPYAHLLQGSGAHDDP